MSEQGTGVTPSGQSPSQVRCQWQGCETPIVPSESLASHLSKHSGTNQEAACKWQGCGSYGVKQASTQQLANHITSHCSEILPGQIIVCLIPECSEIFNTTNMLAKHLKSAHDLQTLRETLRNVREKVKDIEEIKDVNTLLRVIEQNHELKNPWWYTNLFVKVLQGQIHNNSIANKLDIEADEEEEDDDDDERLGVRVSDLYRLPVDLKQHKVANIRYKNYLSRRTKLFGPSSEITDSVNIIKRQKLWEKQDNNEDDDEEDNELINYNQPIHEQLEKESNDRADQYKKDSIDQESIDDIKDLQELKELHQKLQNKLHAASKINKIVSDQLEASIFKKRRLWLINQHLVNANVEIGIPPEETAVPQRVTRDKFDDELLYQ